MSLLDLPSELLRLVFSFVPPNVLPSLCLVHSKFNDILQDDFIWRQIILQQGKLHRSSFRHSYVQYNTNPDEDSFETINATLDPVFTSPSPYQSYHELYVKVFKDYAWMLGTFAGNAQWTGSVIEVFYNHKSGYIEGRRLHGSAIFTNAKYFSLDNDVIWRDFDPVLQAWQEPLFRCGPGVVQEAFAAQLGRSVGITDKATIDSMAYNNIWPTLSVPASERIIVDQAPALARLGNGFEDFSDNLMTISRPVLKCGCKSLRPPHFRLQSST